MNELLDIELRQLLQDNIEIKSHKTGKYIRRGKLQLYSIKDFYILMIIKTAKGDTKNYQLPHPWRWELTPEYMLFDYTLENIHNDRGMIRDVVDDIGESKSPFFDNLVYINRVS